MTVGYVGVRLLSFRVVGVGGARPGALFTSTFLVLMQICLAYVTSTATVLFLDTMCAFNYCVYRHRLPRRHQRRNAQN
jgi:hypothetical protein